MAAPTGDLISLALTLLDEIDALARLRNPYAHYRSFCHPDSLRASAGVAGQDPEVILQSDCERFLVRPHSIEPNSAIEERDVQHVPLRKTSSCLPTDADPAGAMLIPGFPAHLSKIETSKHYLYRAPLSR